MNRCDLRPNSPNPALLIIEDDAAIIGLLKAALASSFPVTVYSAASGDIARELWQIHGSEIIAVLSDLHLGSESGTEIVRELTKDRPDLGVIFMTGSFPEKNDLANEVGHKVEVLQKPFELSKLRPMIEHCLLSHSS